MRRGLFSRWLCVTAVALTAAWAGGAGAAVINFSGQVDVLDDTSGGSARYSGTTLGQLFSGSISYGSLAQASNTVPGDYDFSVPPFGGSISDGTTVTSSTSGEIVQVTVADNVSLDQATADLINTLLGTSLTMGSVVDIADIDTLFMTSGGNEVAFGVSFIATDPNTWTGDDFANFPPVSGAMLPAIFFINETDSLDNAVFEAFGVVDSLAVVPLPAAAWLFIGGCAGLLGFGLRGRRPVGTAA